jgi:uncharacterized protein YciI
MRCPLEGTAWECDVKLAFDFLLRGPNRGQDAATAKRMQGEHLAHVEGQSQQGKLVVAGPIMEESQ